MRYLQTSKLKPGMALGQDIYDGAGRLLWPKHLLLSPEYISNLEFLGYPGIYIDDEFTKGIEIQQILSPQVKRQALNLVHKMFAFDEEVEDVPVSELKIKKTVESMVESLLSNGDVMCNVLDIKNYDDYIYYHSINVAMMSAILGIRCGLDQENLYQLTSAAMMHDIGKKLIDVDIANEKRKLSLQERKMLKEHPKLGADYLRGNYSFSDCINASVAQHHENYDGSGYPFGKGGDNISLFARIIRVADQFDMMISKQPGKKEMSPSDAVEYIMAGMGTKFDPKLVQLFVKKIAVYPVGCEVALSNGRCGVVARNFEGFFLRPLVKIMKTGEMVNLCDDPKYRNVTIIKMI